MKAKLFFFFVICLTVIVTAGCGKSGNCSKYNQVEKPELIKDDYNTCKAVNLNFTFAVRNKTEYPYWSCEGDTLWVHGYLRLLGQMVFRDENYWNVQLFDEADTTSVSNSLPYFVNAGIPVEMIEMDTVDLSCRCYLKGVLTFNNRHWDYIGDDGSGCFFPQCGLLATEITLN